MRRRRPDQPRTLPFRSLRVPGAALVALFALLGLGSVAVVVTALRLQGHLETLEEPARWTAPPSIAGLERTYLWAQLLLVPVLLLTVVAGMVWQYRAACNQTALSDRRLGCSPTAVFWLFLFWLPMLPREQGYIAPVASLAEIWRTSLGVVRRLPIQAYRRISTAPVWLAWGSLVAGCLLWVLGFGWYSGYRPYVGLAGNRSELESAVVFQVIGMIALLAGTGVGSYLVLQVTRWQQAAWRQRQAQEPDTAAATWQEAVNE